jgi:acyl-CoA thioesterase YciA
MGHEGVKIAGREPVLRVMPMPADMNGNGDIFGGWVMAQCDIAAAIPAMRLARGRHCHRGGEFLPVQAADLGRRHRQFLCRDRQGWQDLDHRRHAGLCGTQSGNPVVVKVTEAQFTYVAINDDGSKRELPASPG